MSGRKLTPTAVVAIILAASSLAFDQNGATTAVKTGYAPMNGIRSSRHFAGHHALYDFFIADLGFHGKSVP